MFSWLSGVVVFFRVTKRWLTYVMYDVCSTCSLGIASFGRIVFWVVPDHVVISCAIKVPWVIFPVEVAYETTQYVTRYNSFKIAEASDVKVTRVHKNN